MSTKSALREGTLQFRIKGPDAWPASGILDATNDFDVLNPDLHIARLADDARTTSSICASALAAATFRQTITSARVIRSA